MRRGLALVSTIVVAAVSGAAPSAAAGPPTWGACPAKVAVTAPTLQCATVTVPLDYRNPAGTTIDLTVSRIASTNPAKRRGILLLNPGGPGVSGLDMPANLVSQGIPNSVLDAYDLIGMDTRGVATPQATPTVAWLTSRRPTRPGTWTGSGWRWASRRPASSERRTGRHWAPRTPRCSRAAPRIIIDSNLGDTALTRAGLRRFASGMEQGFPDFARWAAARHGAYGLGRTPQGVHDTYFAIAERLDAKPVAGVDGRFLRQFSYTSLFNPSAYGVLAQLWQSLTVADGAAANRAVPDGAQPAAKPQPHQQSDFLSAYLAVICNDSTWPSDVAEYQRSSPRIGRGSRSSVRRPATSTRAPSGRASHPSPRSRSNDDGPANILIMQNRRDVATPLEGAQIIRREFAERSRLVMVDDNQHGVYVYGDNACALTIGTDWLVNGDLPRDTTCES
jgi:hypothetical protein